MKDRAKKIIENDITDRLEQIAFHFEQRNKVQSMLSQYRGEDYETKSPIRKIIQELVSRIQSEELSTLSELVHLFDNVTKYFDAHQLKKGELDVVNKFKPFRVASNFINVHKHGIRGRNRPSAKLDYYALVFARTGEQSSKSDVICDVRSLINYEGNLFDCMILIEELVRIWKMFLSNHTEIDVKPFVSRIGSVLAQRQGQPVYAAKIPVGVLSDAKDKSDERKHLDI